MFGNFPLAGKLVAVTGGIGLAFCKLAVSSGARVIIADLKLNQESEQLVHGNNNVSFYKCNVANWKDLEALVPYAESQFSDVPDMYAANAGVGESIRHVGRNLAHPIKLSRIALRALWSRDKKGVVVVTSSVAGLHGHFSTPLYCTSKHGTIGLIKSLARAETEANVKVVGVCPG
ncbi:hypothetical protein SCUCBS95973_004092 [Sporothrix curviconia]|uniref:Uncharacterized protein n=1 Tax=Sporothrix curviconia TaxID=1260050 RepID=A0ABP0BKS9_9PEZI